MPVAGVRAFLWVAEPLFGRYAIDTIIASPDNFWPMFGGWLGMYALISVVAGIWFYLRWGLRNRLLTETRERYYEKLLSLDISHHIQARSGELMKKIDNASDEVINVFEQLIVELIPAILTTITFYIISFFISWKLTLVALALLPVYFCVVFVGIIWTRRQQQHVNKLWVASIGRAYDAVTNIFTVKSSGAEVIETNSMQSIHQEGLSALNKVNVVWAAIEGINFFMLLRITLAAVGVLLLSREGLSIGTLFFFLSTFWRLITPFEMLGRFLPQWTEKMHKISLAEELFEQTITVNSPKNAKTLQIIQGEIRWNNVDFSYEEADTLQGINLHIAPGEHIALVGHSGAGKSTMALLLNRFYDPTSGSITIDGTDIRELDVHWWRQQIGLVLQENIMFNDSVLENIRYSKPDATDEEVIEAAKRAHAHDFIKNLPNQYQSKIGERGIRLSGGERQRTAIARAILKDSAIVVLDEATSALDSVTERKVQQGIDELMKHKTAIIIAHRLSTVESADRIVVLENGKIIACGSHKELLEINEVYRNMVELQSGGLLSDKHEVDDRKTSP